MKLIIAIIQDEVVGKVTKDLTKHDFRVTKLASSGGFLKAGNTTLLMGVEEEKLDELVEVISSNIKEKKLVKHNGLGEEVDVKSANIFVIDMEDFKKI